jgi:predicted MFS family arabinose efflux permease
VDSKTNMGLDEGIGDCANSPAMPGVPHGPGGSMAVPPRDQAARHFSSAVVGLFATGAAIVAAGSYFAQPVAATIGLDLSLPPGLAGLIVTVGQAGYVFGLLFVALLGDLVENRRLVLSMLLASVTCLLTAAVAPNGPIFLIACFGIGVSSISVQMLVTLAAFMSDPMRRGRAVGTVTSGLLIGILLAWPTASFVSAHLGWRMLFGLDAVVVSGLAFALFRLLPRRVPDHRARYAALVASLWELFLATPELRRRAVRQAFLFGSFSLFWTAVPLELRGHYALSGDGVALFGLVAGVGALVAPIVGRLADAGKGSIVSFAGMIAVVGAFLLAAVAQQVWVLCLAAIAIGAGVQANHVVSQRSVLSLRSDAASRLNSLYVAIFFLGGAVGSAASTPLFHSGWMNVGLVGGVMGVVALALTRAVPFATSRAFAAR